MVDGFSLTPDLPATVFTVSFPRRPSSPMPVWYTAVSVFAESRSMRMYEAVELHPSLHPGPSCSLPRPRSLVRVNSCRARAESWNLVSALPPHGNVMRSVPSFQGSHVHIMERGGSDLFSLMWGVEGDGGGPDKTISPLMGMGVAVELALAVLHLHSHGVCHRDIKPENVVVTMDGISKLVDFDFASVKKTFRLSEFSGTLRYVPRQLQRHLVRMAFLKGQVCEPGIKSEIRLLERRRYNAFRADIFALCTTAIELIVRDPCWDVHSENPFDHPISEISRMFGGCCGQALHECLRTLSSDSLRDLATTFSDTHASLFSGYTDAAAAPAAAPAARSS